MSERNSPRHRWAAEENLPQKPACRTWSNGCYATIASFSERPLCKPPSADGSFRCRVSSIRFNHLPEKPPNWNF